MDSRAVKIQSLQLHEYRPEREQIAVSFMQYPEPLRLASGNYWMDTQTVGKIDGYVAVLDALRDDLSLRQLLTHPGLTGTFNRILTLSNTWLAELREVMAWFLIEFSDTMLIGKI